MREKRRLTENFFCAVVSKEQSSYFGISSNKVEQKKRCHQGLIMSNVQECHAKKHSDNSKIIILNPNNCKQSVETNFIKEISAFEPSEIISVQFSLKPSAYNLTLCRSCCESLYALRHGGVASPRTNCVCNNNEYYKYNLSLIFSSNIHEIYSDYEYKISVQALVSKENQSYHLPLFENLDKRISNEISFTNEFYLGVKEDTHIKHICCTVSRNLPKEFTNPVVS